MTFWMEFSTWWDQIFFTPVNTLTASMMRVLIGAVMIVDSIYWWRLAPVLLSPGGWYGYQDYHEDKEKYLYFSLLKYLPKSLASVRALLALQMLMAVLMLLGIYANLSAAICFITLVSLHNRNLYVLNSGDAVRRFLVLFLVFAPSDLQLSVLHPDKFLSAKAMAWPVAIYLLQFFAANIYFKNVFYKLQGPSWQNGTATRLALGVKIIRNFRLPPFLDQAWFYALTTYGTLVIEAALFTLVWFDPFRIPVLIAGALLHLGIAIFLRLPLFQLSMIILLCSFIRPEEYQMLISWLLK